MANPVSMPTARQRAFQRLVGAFRQELVGEGARAYVDGLKDYPDDRLIAGVDRAIKECPTFPSVATLREQIRLAQPAVEAVRFLPAPRPTDDEADPTTWVTCRECMDSGWRYTRIPHPAGYDVDAAFKCACFETNPRVRMGIGGRAQ